MCSQSFYADKEKEHSLFCMQQISQKKTQDKFNLKFMEIYCSFTECIVSVDLMN